MSMITLASATDIARWAGTRAAQERLPELVRRLVYATTEAPTYVDFPSGDAVQLGGYDGAVELAETHPIIPLGLSVWEMGTSDDPKGKADDDYDKRTAPPPATARGVVVPAVTTFIFVTPRRWGAKDKWASNRRAEGKWADVRVLDAVDLEGWLQNAAAAHVWLSRLLGLVPEGVDDMETIWADWADSLTPRASPALMMAGRAEQAAQAVSWLKQPGRNTLTVSAESTEDALGFIGAAIMSLPAHESAPLLARTAVVTTQDAFVQLAASVEPLILIPTYSIGTEIHRATRSHHRVLIPTGPTLGSGAAASPLLLPRVNRRDAEVALVAMGVAQDRARELAGVARRSMVTLRRRLATSTAHLLPDWSATTEGPTLVPMLLLGQFDEARDADLQALEALAPGALFTVRTVLQRWSREVDPPIRCVGGVWYLVSKEDAWTLLSRYVTKEDVQRFTTVAKQVLSEVHPKFDLPPDQRWVATLHGKERRYSHALVAGVADTVALLGSLGDSTASVGGFAPTSIAVEIVDGAFQALVGSWQGWATLSRVLPLLAEGAPDVFIRAVTEQVARDEATVKELFGDEGDVLFSSSPHTGLLWALETLAWSTDHLLASARVLATLDRLDPGGRIVNRPGNSLRAIFLPWLPQTSADLDARLIVLAQLRQYEPEATWRLLMKLLPRFHDHSGQTPRPTWRDWVVDGAGNGASYADIFRQTTAFIDWMTADAGDDATRWVALVEALDNVGPGEFDTICQSLAAALIRLDDDEFRTPIFDALREQLSKHRSFADAAWALPAARLLQLEPLFVSATPHDPVKRLRWLFSNHPQLPQGREDDFDSFQDLLKTTRQDAVRELLTSLGSQGLLTAAKNMERPDECGEALALSGLIPSDEEIAYIQQILSLSDRTGQAFGRGYAVGWTRRLTHAVAFDRIRDKALEWSDDTRGQLLLIQEPDAATLDLADSLVPEGRNAFWSRIHGYWLRDPVVERGLRSILEVGRSHAAVHAAAFQLRNHPDLDPALLAVALFHAPMQKADVDGSSISAHDVGQVLDALEAAATAGRFDMLKVAQLELLYLPLLGHFERPPRVLHRAMSEDPALFIEAVTNAYRATGEAHGSLTPEEARRAELSYHLLQSWRTPPGSVSTGIDEKRMNDWIDVVRAELGKHDRLESCDSVLGQCLSGPERDADTAWPRIQIRDLIERLESEQFERGLKIGRFNGRGVISKDIYDGGSHEHAEAEMYERMAKVVSVRWHRTGAMLRQLADSARAHATHEDLDAELRQDLES